MPLSSKFLTGFTGKKTCGNWSTFSEDMEKSTIAYFLAHPVYRIYHFDRSEATDDVSLLG